MKKTITLFLCTFATSGLMAQGNTSWMAAGIDPAQMRDVPAHSSILRSTDMDYSQGTFIVNEDWYGHQNSTVNFLTHDGEWHYRVFQTENPGHEPGCTTHFGTIYGDKFYLVSKQERDPGAKITGSRFAVCDAKTMKVIKEFKYIAQNAEGKSIADVLDMTINRAVEFFENVPQILNKIKVLQEVGLGYIKLGQPSTTLSGGESQRVKLATELSKRDTGKTMYILDEPTTGLHFEDIRVLMNVLNKLVEKGNTVLVIEHNLDVIKLADYIIDMGPEGGRGGGQVLAAGTPEEVAESKKGYTPKFIKEELEN